jgi:two-component system chemotaxis response regulator CheB
MVLEGDCICLNQGPKVHFARPAIDPLFMSAAGEHGRDVMGVLLSGGDADGAQGLRAIRASGGAALVQCPDEAFNASMPSKALAEDRPEALPTEEIAQWVRAFCFDGSTA